MATYESIIKITGAVGDLVFYDLNGKKVVRKKSGFNKTAFKKNPSYEKVRQNSSEFGHCSKTGKAIRNSLNVYIKTAGDPLLYQKFAKLMTEVKDLDMTSERGKRTVENGLKTEEGQKLLREFQFGGIKKTADRIRIENQTLHLKHSSLMYKMIILTIKLDSEHCNTEYAEEILPLDKQQEIVFQQHFSEKSVLLYFAALQNEDNEITHMGFV
ncbi:hypothetical protein [Chryseobacterium sp.]|uniref:hypothetical protein n=1 Tax=Chryseobacterium sp. TaxID=1871047 RepID=UPI002635A481|nr:hypothetical protein [Chryseobacterium sp.]